MSDLHYNKFHSIPRKIMQLCQLNLLNIDYPINEPSYIIGTCKKS